VTGLSVQLCVIAHQQPIASKQSFCGLTEETLTWATFFLNIAQLVLLGVVKKLRLGEWNIVFLLKSLHPKLPLRF